MPKRSKPSGNKKRDRARGISSFNRKAETRTQRNCILIVCEGESTEPTYFEKLRIHLKLDSVDVIIRGEECKSDPVSVVEYALEQKKQRDREAKISPTQAPFNEVWCVIDTETPVDNQVALERATAKARAQKKFMHLAVSNPCFEYWLLLHFRHTSQPFRNASQVIHKLKEHLPNYEKRYQDFEELFGLIEQAMGHAQAVRANHVDGGRYPNPSTYVDQLVDVLVKMKNFN
ncbi:MAG TPA: RloB family protein [Anaerolineae bacterium]|nr:RloB family protein [Anaerolineae bacterium]